MKKLHLLLLLLGFAFLGYLIWEIGPGELWHELGLLGWGLIPLVLVEGVAELFHAIGWRYCLSEPHRSLSFLRIYRIRLAGFALNYLTPTASVGGEVAKAGLLASDTHGPEAVSGVLIGKLCFGFAHLLFVMLGSVIVLWRISLPPPLWIAMLVSSVLLIAGMAGFLLVQKYGKIGSLVRWLVARKFGGRPLQTLARQMTNVDEALKLFYRQRPWALVGAILWHLVGYSVGLFQTWYFYSLLTKSASLTIAAATWFLGMWFDLVTFAVPVNIGILEWSRIMLVKAVGYNALTGMTYGLALRLAQLFWAIVGLLNYALLAAPDKKSLPVSPRYPINE